MQTNIHNNTQTVKQKLNERINIEIMENELNASDWPLSELAIELYWWCDFFNIAFFKDTPVPIPAISFEKTSIKTLGHYIGGRNSFGIMENINLNSCYLHRPLWDIIATLIHEMAHSWQKIYGKPSNSWFHNKEFQIKMSEMGIMISNKGYHIGVGDPFVFLLKKHGIQFNLKIGNNGIMEIPPKPKPKGKSKLRKWQCPCGQNVRVGKKDFFAECTLCQGEFALVQ